MHFHFMFEFWQFFVRPMWLNSHNYLFSNYFHNALSRNTTKYFDFKQRIFHLNSHVKTSQKNTCLPTKPNLQDLGTDISTLSTLLCLQFCSTTWTSDTVLLFCFVLFPGLYEFVVKSTGRKNSAVQKQDYEDLSWVLKNTTAFNCLPSRHILTLFHCTSAICSSHGNVRVLLR